MDTPEHTFFVCSKFEAYRAQTYNEIGHKITKYNVAEVLLRGENEWKSVSRLMTNIMKEKIEEEKY